MLGSWLFAVLPSPNDPTMLCPVSCPSGMKQAKQPAFVLEAGCFSWGRGRKSFGSQLQHFKQWKQQFASKYTKCCGKQSAAFFCISTFSLPEVFCFQVQTEIFVLGTI